MNVTVKCESNRPVAFWVTSDWHLGHVAFDKELFERHRQLALKARAKMLFGGDALEAVITGSKVANLGGQYDQNLSVGDQEDLFIDYCKGFNVVAATGGNHEARISRVTGTDPFRNLCRTLSAQQGRPCHHLPFGGYVTIKVGKQTYRLVLHHGEGSASQYFKLMQRDWPDADCYLAGHTHELMNAEHFRHTAAGPKRVVTVRMGSYLAFPSYSAHKPSSNGIPATGSYLLWLRPDRHQLTLEKLSDRALNSAA